MIWLVSASVIWAFSFGLIKGLTVGVDPFVLGAIRTFIAAIFFAPWFFFKRNENFLSPRNLKAFTCGVLQIGLMYGPYLMSFRYLQAHEVALYTMTTPIIMAILGLFYSRERVTSLISASLLATVGGLVVASDKITSIDLQIGVALVQLSNLLFAAGILLWQKYFSNEAKNQSQLMFPFFAGAALASLALAGFFAKDIRPYSAQEWMVFIYLGVVASGCGFFLWNRGSLRVSTSTLTAANNLKLPIAIIVSLTVFREKGDLLRLLVGGVLLLTALHVARGVSHQKTI